jgi:hypothetical protein
MIRIISEDGREVIMRKQDLLNVWHLPEKGMRVVNFVQGTKEMSIWTNQTLEEIEVQLEAEHVD